MPPFPDALVPWSDFYVVVGTSGATLTALMFVTMTLTAQAGIPSAEHQIATFATPSVVHFGVSLLVSGVMLAPWRHAERLALVLAVGGALGVLYSVGVVRGMRRQREYAPVFEDWLFHAVLPAVGYALLGAAGWRLRASPDAALDLAALAALGFLFVGIHNAWDTLVWFAAHRLNRDGGAGSGEARAAGDVGPGGRRKGAGGKRRRR